MLGTIQGISDNVIALGRITVLEERVRHSVDLYFKW